MLKEREDKIAQNIKAAEDDEIKAYEGTMITVLGTSLQNKDILSYFMQRPRHVVDKAVLAEAVWGDHVDQSDNFHFVYSQVKNLRRKLEEAGASIEIKAVYGFGYKLID